MTDDITKLIDSYQGWNAKEIKRYPLDAERVISDLLVKLEAEHQQAEEWRVLGEKAANGVLTLQAERDALRTAIREVMEHEMSCYGKSETWIFLSRAIDTKEEKP